MTPRRHLPRLARIAAGGAVMTGERNKPADQTRDRWVILSRDWDLIVLTIVGGAAIVKAALLLLLSGCAAADIAIGAVVVDYATAKVTHEVAHACDCDSTKGPWQSCQGGAGLCCRTCGKVCVLEAGPAIVKKAQSSEEAR